MSGWLHRLAAFSSSAEEVARRVVQNCWTLITIGCDVAVVFDGDTNSDAKRATNEARAAQVQASQAPRRTKEQMFAVINALQRADIRFLGASVSGTLLQATARHGFSGRRARREAQEGRLRFAGARLPKCLQPLNQPSAPSRMSLPSTRRAGIARRPPPLPSIYEDVWPCLSLARSLRGPRWRARRHAPFGPPVPRLPLGAGRPPHARARAPTRQAVRASLADGSAANEIELGSQVLSPTRLHWALSLAVTTSCPIHRSSSPAAAAARESPPRAPPPPRAPSCEGQTARPGRTARSRPLGPPLRYPGGA